jgi:hypothetical protein
MIIILPVPLCKHKLNKNLVYCPTYTLACVIPIPLQREKESRSEIATSLTLLAMTM